MQQRRGRIRGSELRKRRFLADLQLIHLGLELGPGEAAVRLNTLTDYGANALELALCG